MERVRELIHSLWPSLPPGFDISPYERLAEERFNEDIALLLSTQRITSDSFLSVLDCLRANAGKTKSELEGLLPSNKFTIESPGRSTFDFVASVWLPLKFATNPSLQREQALEWKSDETLDQAVSSFFASRETLDPSQHGKKLPKNFALWDLGPLTPLRPRWTDNLAEHLQLDEERGTVAIYAHPIYLQNHLLHSKTYHVPIPSSILDETLDTLLLLLASGKRRNRSQSFMVPSKLAPSFDKAIFAGRKRITNLDHYKTWGSNLLQLMDYMEEANKRAIIVVETANYMLTLLVGIFALIGTVLAAFSIWLAHQANQLAMAAIDQGQQSLNLAAAQFELSVAELCNDTDIARKLPRHCQILEAGGLELAGYRSPLNPVGNGTEVPVGV